MGVKAVIFSKAEEEPCEEPMEPEKTEEPDMSHKGTLDEGGELKHKAEYQCEWPARGKGPPESHKVHHHGGKEEAARQGEEDASPEPGNPDFWPSAELDQDEDWEPPTRNEPDSSPWCDLEEGEE